MQDTKKLASKQVWRRRKKMHTSKENALDVKEDGRQHRLKGTKLINGLRGVDKNTKQRRTKG